MFFLYSLWIFGTVAADIRSCKRYSYSNRPSQDCSSCGLTSPPKLFNSVISLNLANNSLEIIENLPSSYSTLLSLRMDHCLIKAIRPKALGQLKNLKNLDLSHNQLDHIVIPRHITQLTTLNLSHNKLRHLPDFSGLTSLRLLDLSYNNLLSVAPRHLPYNLESLRLTANFISHLTHWPFLQKLQELDVSFNPLLCECSLWKFVTWAEQMALFDSSTLPCRKPSSLRRTTAGEILCGPEIHESKEISTKVVSLGDPAQLCCTVASSPAAFVFWQHGDRNLTKGLTTHPLVESGRSRFCLDLPSVAMSHLGQYRCVALLGEAREEKIFVIEKDKIPLVLNSAEHLIFYAQFSICAFLGVFCFSCCCCLKRNHRKTRPQKKHFECPVYISSSLNKLEEFEDDGDHDSQKYVIQSLSEESCIPEEDNEWGRVQMWRTRIGNIHAPLAKFDSETNILSLARSDV